MILRDGTVIPSYLGTRGRGAVEDVGAFTNTTLRVGEVKAIVYPDSEESSTKAYIEYTVEVQHRTGSGPGTAVLYTNCLLANTFGTGGDLFRYTLRADPENNQNRGDDGVGVGAKVLILCINGEHTRSWILSGVRDPESDTTKDKKDDGHNLLWEFNGIRSTINDDGELKIVFRGKTKVNGELADGVEESNGGAQFFFDKEGGVTIADGDAGEESLVFSLADKKTTLTSGGTMELNAPDGIVLDTDKNIDLVADKVHVGSANAGEAFVLGTTYRDKEGSMHGDLSSGFQDMAQQCGQLAGYHAACAAQLAAAGSSMATPIGGAVAAGPQIAAAGAQLVLMGTTLGQMAATLGKMLASLKQFEAQASSFISDRLFGEK